MLCKFMAGTEKCDTCKKHFQTGETVFVYHKINKDGTGYTLIQHEMC